MFGFPQELDEQDINGGGESEQAMLPSSLSQESQGSKPNGAIQGFDMNSGLSVWEHLRGEKVNRSEGVVWNKKGLILLISVPFDPVIPRVTRHLLSNPVFSCITLAACMEIAVVAGFAAFLGKYLEQQFNLTTSSANQLLGTQLPFFTSFY